MFFKKIVKNEFLAVEDVSNMDDGHEQGGINGQKCFSLQRLIKSDKYTKKKQERLTNVDKQNSYLSHIVNAIYVNITYS